MGYHIKRFYGSKKPELFEAYIGIGQMANQPLPDEMSYDFVIEEAIIF